MTRPLAIIPITESQTGTELPLEPETLFRVVSAVDSPRQDGHIATNPEQPPGLYSCTDAETRSFFTSKTNAAELTSKFTENNLRYVRCKASGKKAGECAG